MKKAGLVLLAIGVLITIFNGVNFVTREKVVDIGSLEISADKNHSVNWSPYLGVVLIVLGGGAYLLAGKKS
ncbi:hypothetical protein RT717_13935 [Imperialibacter roseus]|uniref:DUF3185 domain-containing protein n=1 Tax=Imperialibacter roseus TaxID=1324217 RepID=A0ABZ0IIN8_9BACT|nr:hypothetical protein [Imperialibacter roseus]WOK04175.1 hypothetical protein RT717_13935 [Imperialibacter roseus]